MIEHNSQTIAQIVRQYLQNQHPGGVNLDVVEQGIRKDEFNWHVPVQPSTEPPKLFEYYEVLTEIEDELAKHEQIKVFLVPSEPRQEAVA